MRLRLDVLITLTLSFLVTPVFSHEFWISGDVEEVAGETFLELDLRVGQQLEGVSLPYVPETFEVFEWVFGGDGAITSRLGNIPAARLPFEPDRGAVVFHRTTPRTLTHSDWGMFLTYLEMEGLDGIAEAHSARELPRSGFQESYTRHAKFVFVAPGQREIPDRYVGSPTEIVLQHIDTIGDSVTIYGHVVDNESAANLQISYIFGHAEGVMHETLRTDADGEFRISIPVFDQLLLNVVSIREGSPGGAEWHSDWASTLVRMY